MALSRPSDRDWSSATCDGAWLWTVSDPGRCTRRWRSTVRADHIPSTEIDFGSWRLGGQDGTDANGLFEPDAGEPRLAPDLAVEQLGEEDTLALGVGRVVLDNLHMKAILAANLEEIGVLQATPSRRVLNPSEILGLVRESLKGLGFHPPIREFVAEALNSARQRTGRGTASSTTGGFPIPAGSSA